MSSDAGSKIGVEHREQLGSPLPNSHHQLATVEEQLKREDAIRSEALVTELEAHPEYLTSQALWGSAVALGVGVLATYWSFIIPAGSVSYINADIGPSDNASLVTIIWSCAVPISLILFGRLSDQFGRRIFCLLGLALGVVADIIACTAKSMDALIVANALLGLGGGPFVAYSLYAETVPNNWRYIYYIGIALNGLGFILYWIFYHPATFRQIHGKNRTYMDEIKRIDFIGLFLLVSGTVLFILGVSWGGSPLPWDSPRILGLLISGAILLVIFVAWEIFGNAPLPLMPIRIFKETKGIFMLIALGTAGRIIFTSQNVVWPSLVSLVYLPNLNASNWQTAGWVNTIPNFGAFATFVILPFMNHLRHTKIIMIVATAWVAAFLGGMAAANPSNKSMAEAFTFLALFPISILNDFPLLFVQFVCKEAELGLVVCLLLFLQTFFGSVFTTVFLAILDNKLPKEIVKYATNAAVSNGLPESSVPTLLANLATMNFTSVPGITPQITEAVIISGQWAGAKALTYVTYAGLAITLFALVVAFFMPSFDEYFTSRIARKVYNRNTTEADEEIEKAVHEKEMS